MYPCVAETGLARSSAPRCALLTASSSSPSAPVAAAAWPGYRVASSTARPCSAWRSADLTAASRQLQPGRPRPWVL